MMLTIAGFCLVEKDFCAAVPELPPYRGYDRDPWGRQWVKEWFRQDFRASSAPIQYREWNRDNSPVKLVRELNWALGIKAEGQEVFAITSHQLCKIKGSVQIHDSQVEWLGYEPLSEWSLITNGVYACPELFSEKWADRLNHNGLLDDSSLGQLLLDDYLSLMGDDKKSVEPLSSLEVDVVRVGRVRHDDDGDVNSDQTT